MTGPDIMPATPHPSRWANELLRSLQNAGLLDDPGWQEAFAAIPRHHFLPHFYSSTGDTWRRVDTHSVGEGDWYRLAYRDQTWVMRLSGPRSQPGQPASSSIQPSVAARMLNELVVTSDSRVLEIGTGTGYLTALLCHRIGGSNITSIDIDSELIDSAGRLLAELGYTPTLATADGTYGFPDHAPYDRVLDTAAVDRIPQTWIDQTRPGGRIVAPLRSAIAIIDVHNDQNATGRFLPNLTRVLPLRTQTDGLAAYSPLLHATSATPTMHSPIPIHALYDDNFRFLLDIALPGIEYDDKGPLSTLTLRHPDGSTVQISPAGQMQQHGPRRLCDDIAAIHETWNTVGNPGPDQYRLTIDPQNHTIWLNDPQGPHHWEL